jgi:hypothetical protein
MMTTDPYMEWLAAARRADAVREELGQLLRSGQKPPQDLLDRLARLEDKALGLQAKVGAVVPQPGKLH